MLRKGPNFIEDRLIFDITVRKPLFLEWTGEQDSSTLRHSTGQAIAKAVRARDQYTSIGGHATQCQDLRRSAPSTPGEYSAETRRP